MGASARALPPAVAGARAFEGAMVTNTRGRPRERGAHRPARSESADADGPRDDSRDVPPRRVRGGQTRSPSRLDAMRARVAPPRARREVCPRASRHRPASTAQRVGPSEQRLALVRSKKLSKLDLAPWLRANSTRADSSSRVHVGMRKRSKRMRFFSYTSRTPRRSARATRLRSHPNTSHAAFTTFATVPARVPRAVPSPHVRPHRPTRRTPASPSPEIFHRLVTRATSTRRRRRHRRRAFLLVPREGLT